MYVNDVSSKSVVFEALEISSFYFIGRFIGFFLGFILGRICSSRQVHAGIILASYFSILITGSNEFANGVNVFFH